MTLNKSLKMTSNNSNLNMSIKNNNNNNNSNNGKLIQQKLKNNKINKKIIHKKKILHDKKASMTNPSTFDCKKNGLIYDKKNALDKAFSPRFNLLNPVPTFFAASTVESLTLLILYLQYTG